MIYKFLISSVALNSVVVRKVVRYVLGLCLEYLVRSGEAKHVWMCETDFAYEPDFRVFDTEEGLEKRYKCVRAGGCCKVAFGYVVKVFERA
jgi:hypothetical protein